MPHARRAPSSSAEARGCEGSRSRSSNSPCAREQEGEFGVQAIVGALADGLVVADRERRIRLMNDAFRQMFGIDSRLTNGTLLETVRDAAVERLLGEALTRGEMGRSTITLQRPAGSEIYLEVVAEPIKDEPGAVSGAVILFRDITELRRIETMRRDFVANVSHELLTRFSEIFLFGLTLIFGSACSDALRLF